MMIFGALFDQLDSGGDYWNIGVVNNLLSPVAITPDGLGKSTRGTNATGYIVCQMPSDQSGKTLYIKVNISLQDNIGNYGMMGITSDATGVTQQIGLCYNPIINRFQLRRGTTSIATGTWDVNLTGFFTLQIEVKVDNSTGVFKVYVDGNTTPDISFTGDTQNQSSASVWGVSFGNDGSNANCAPYIHDPIVFNSDGTKNNALVPINFTGNYITIASDGASTWTKSTGETAYTLLDELEGEPNDTDYVYTSTLNARNIVGVSSIPSNVGTVGAVQLNSRMLRTETGGIGITPSLKVGASEKAGTPVFLSLTARHYVNIFEYKTGTTPIDAADLSSVELVHEVTTIN